MAERVQKQKSAPQKQDKTEKVEAKKRTEEQQEALDYAEDLLDEIDDVLEQNAEQFVKDYVQKGGQAVALPLGWLRRWLSFPAAPRFA